MSLSIYESVVQPILRRLSRSSNDSDNSRGAVSNRNGSVLRENGNAIYDSPSLEEEEDVLRPSELVLEPTTEPRHVALTGTGSGIRVDEPVPLPRENYTGGTRRSHGSAHAGVARDPSAHGDGHTSSNPSHGVPQSFTSPASSDSSSAQSLRSLAIEQAREDPSMGAAQGGRTRSVSSLPTRVTEGPLPADDGMSVLRKRIVEIQSADGSQEEKSRVTHALMTERYTLSHPNLHFPHPRSHSPASFSSIDRPATPRSTQSYSHMNLATSPPTSLSSVANAVDPFNLSPEDRQPTYYSKPRSSSDFQDHQGTVADSSNGSSEFAEEFGCAHYKRNIKLQCSACGGWYTCRFCHDEVEDHSLNRRETKYMLCMFCGCAQKASHICANCEERAAWYYCDVCKLWDDDPRRSIYHCHDCGICRVGQGLGKDFFHCKICCVCLSIKMEDSHRCIERSTDCDCPICGDYMFTSQQTVVFMQCGHSIHHECYKEHMRSSYKCPICSRSVVNMETQFGHLQRQIDIQPMPPQFRDTKALVYCNDCSAKTTVKYHWLGTRCEVCESFNTAQLRILAGQDLETIPFEVMDNDLGLQPLPDNQANPSRPPSRGRTSQLARLTRRSGTSTSALQSSRGADAYVARRAIRSASPGLSARSPANASSNRSSIQAMDVDDELEEYNILGMHSPSDREVLGFLQGSSDGEDGQDDEEVDEDDDDDEDDEDRSDESGSAEGEDPDCMEIQGHW